MPHLTAHFKLDRETKGAIRYQEIDAQGNALNGDADGALIGTLYLRKAALKASGAETPDTFTVMLDEADDLPVRRVA